MSSTVAPDWKIATEDRRLKVVGLALLGAGAVTVAWLSNHVAGVWPLSARQFAAFALVALLTVNLLAASLLVLAAGCGATHTWQSPGRRRAIALQILLANLLAPVLLYGLIVDDAGTEAQLDAQGLNVAGSILVYFLALLAWRLWRCSRRYDAIGADEAMARDPRPPVLYLRSFRDDADALIDDGGSSLTRHVMQALQPPSPEQEMADILSRIGPVVAIGKPGEPVPQLGAARLYVSNEAWQRRVTELMQQASLVVVRLGSSPGVLWEIEQALAHLPRQRVVLAVLGAAAVAPELVDRLAPVLGPSFEAALPQAPRRGWTSMLYRDPRRRIGGLVCFDAGGAAQAVPVRVWPLAWRDAVFYALVRPSAAPLRRAWRGIFADLGLASAFAAGQRSRALAVLLAAGAGWAGAQWFYLGHRRRGWLYVCTLPLFLAPVFLSLVDAVRFIWVDRQEFEARFVATRAPPGRA